MTLLLIFVNAPHAEAVEALLDRRDVAGYSLIDPVLGRGSTGAKLGTRAFPGSSTLFFTVLVPEHAAALVEEIRRLDAERGADAGLKVYALKASELV